MDEISIIDKIVEILSKSESVFERYSSEIDSLKERKLRAEKNKYRLGVIGVTSCGKSTMINAFLGESLLPVAAKPSSSQLVSCFYDSKRYANVYFEEGKYKSLKDSFLSLDAISRYADEQGNPDNKEMVRQIEIASPKFEFPKEIILIDSPGLDAYGFENHEHLTMDSLLPTVDFCIFVTTCKPSSDAKMGSMLNSAAEYEKPIIIVQNMLDSVRPSPDGEKTAAQVALECKQRLEKVVTRSEIKDKSSVSIVQISAMNALAAREQGGQGQKLKQSNYKLLVDTIVQVFNQIKPRVEQNRLSVLKKEIDRIQKEAAEDGKGSDIPLPPFEFDGTIENIVALQDHFKNLLSKKCDGLKKEKDNYYNLSQIRYKREEIANLFGERTKYIRTEIEKVCKKLNISARDLYDDLYTFPKRDLVVQMKKVGHWETTRPIKHFFATIFNPDSHKGQEWVESEQVIDEEKTRESVKQFIDETISHVEHLSNIWDRKFEKTKGLIEKEIDYRRNAYNARREQALDKATYTDVAKKLKELSSTIRCNPEKSTKIRHSESNLSETVTERIVIPQTVFNVYILSLNIKKRIQQTAISLVSNNQHKNVIIGWDEMSETWFASRCFADTISTSDIHAGYNTFRNVSIIHNAVPSPEQLQESNVFIMLNAIQIGAAKNQLKDIIFELAKNTGPLFVVIQDLAEVINGNALEEVLGEVRDYCKRSFANSLILVNHENPVYLVAAIQAQKVGCKFLADEVETLNRLQQSFPYLMKGNVSNHIKTILNTLGK